MRRIDSTKSVSGSKPPKKRNNGTDINQKKPQDKNACVSGQKDAPIKKRKIMTKFVISTTMRGKIMRMNYTTLRDIRRLQKTNKLLIPKAPFSRLVREIIQSCDGGGDFRFEKKALECLQEATEVQMSLWFTKMNFFAGHAKRVTVTMPDCNLNTMLNVLPISL